MPVLHVVIPFYNEERTLDPCVRRVLAATLPAGWSASLVLVDDHSRDSARQAAERLVADLVQAGQSVTLLRHDRNRGKGSAVRTGIEHAIGTDTPEHRRARDLLIIQDADLEYDPGDFAALMEPVLAGRADAAFGNRWGGLWRQERSGLSLHRRVHRVGNGLLTLASNLLTGIRVRDMECCYKLMPVELASRMLPQLTEERFGIEPQIAAVLGRLGARVAEVDVHYAPRSYGEGKKIGVRDGFRALWVLMRERWRTTMGGRPHDTARRGPP